jgi:predicted CDP-diglyceride synthetase/phosphatidate cytidylyltransferase
MLAADSFAFATAFFPACIFTFCLIALLTSIALRIQTYTLASNGRECQWLLIKWVFRPSRVATRRKLGSIATWQVCRMFGVLLLINSSRDVSKRYFYSLSAGKRRVIPNFLRVSCRLDGHRFISRPQSSQSPFNSEETISYTYLTNIL